MDDRQKFAVSRIDFHCMKFQFDGRARVNILLLFM